MVAHISNRPDGSYSFTSTHRAKYHNYYVTIESEDYFNPRYETERRHVVDWTHISWLYYSWTGHFSGRIWVKTMCGLYKPVAVRRTYTLDQWRNIPPCGNCLRVWNTPLRELLEV